jgi:hypothetical protein
MPSAVSSLILEAGGDHGRKAGPLGALHRDQSLADPGKRFADNEIDALVDLHGELLVEGLADAIGGGRTAGLLHPCQAPVPGNQTLISCNLAGHADSWNDSVPLLKPPWPVGRGWRRT